MSDYTCTGSTMLQCIFHQTDCICLFLQITGIPWTTNYSNGQTRVAQFITDRPFNATVQESLDPGTNCTFYICYQQSVISRPYYILGKTSPASCITGNSLYICSTYIYTRTQTHTHAILLLNVYTVFESKSLTIVT